MAEVANTFNRVVAFDFSPHLEEGEETGAGKRTCMSRGIALDWWSWWVELVKDKACFGQKDDAMKVGVAEGRRKIVASTICGWLVRWLWDFHFIVL